MSLKKNGRKNGLKKANKGTCFSSINQPSGKFKSES